MWERNLQMRQRLLKDCYYYHDYYSGDFGYLVRSNEVCSVFVGSFCFNVILYIGKLPWMELSGVVIGMLCRTGLRSTQYIQLLSALRLGGSGTAQPQPGHGAPSNPSVSVFQHKLESANSVCLSVHIWEKVEERNRRYWNTQMWSLGAFSSLEVKTAVSVSFGGPQK